FPILSPRPTVVINEAWIGVRQLRRPAVRIPNIAQTFDVGVSAILIIGRRAPCEAISRMDGCNEGVGIVEHRFMIESDELAARVVRRLERLHSFHFVAELEHGMRECPALNIRSPEDEGGSIPESDGLSPPLRHFLNMLLFADHDLAEKVVCDAGNRLN